MFSIHGPPQSCFLSKNTSKLLHTVQIPVKFEKKSGIKAMEYYYMEEITLKVWENCKKFNTLGLVSF